MIHIHVNGQSKSLDGPLTLYQLLESLQLTSSLIAIALNSGVVPSSELMTTNVKDGDQIEIVKASAGG